MWYTIRNLQNITILILFYHFLWDFFFLFTGSKRIWFKLKCVYESQSIKSGVIKAGQFYRLQLFIFVLYIKQCHPIPRTIRAKLKEKQHKRWWCRFPWKFVKHQIQTANKTMQNKITSHKKNTKTIYHSVSVSLLRRIAENVSSFQYLTGNAKTITFFCMVTQLTITLVATTRASAFSFTIRMLPPNILTSSA